MRDTVTVVHRNGRGFADYVVGLTFDFLQEEGQWVGVCLELGTSTYAESLERTQEELREAVELHLNEMERLCDIQEYLDDAHARVVWLGPDGDPERAGFGWPTMAHRRS